MLKEFIIQDPINGVEKFKNAITAASTFIRNNQLMTPELHNQIDSFDLLQFKLYQLLIHYSNVVGGK